MNKNELWETVKMRVDSYFEKKEKEGWLMKELIE